MIHQLKKSESAPFYMVEVFIGVIALALVLLLSNSNYAVLLWAQQQQHSTNIQNTDGTLGGQNKVSILGDRPGFPVNTSFSPNVINVTIGDTVTWTNHDVMPHTVKSGTGPSDPNRGKEFDSGLTPLTHGKTFSHKFTRAGEFPYFCQLHPIMTGIVTVT
jgi:hypothetical protein